MMDVGGWIALGFFMTGCVGMVIGDRRLTQAKRLFEAVTADRLAVTWAFHLAKAGCWDEAQVVLNEANIAAQKVREEIGS